MNLAGKDYFTQEEAAHYCCVCVRKFRDESAKYRIVPFRFMGKMVYRRADLQAIIENEWQRFAGGTASRGSGGSTRTGNKGRNH